MASSSGICDVAFWCGLFFLFLSVCLSPYLSLTISLSGAASAQIWALSGVQGAGLPEEDVNLAHEGLVPLAHLLDRPAED